MEDKKGYLILTRRQDQSIMIGDDIEIMHMGGYGCSVRLGVLAPKDVMVHRREIWETVQRQKTAGPHLCVQHANYHIARTGMRVATCELCGFRWGIPDEVD